VNKLGPVNVGGSNPVRIMGIINTSPESFYKKSILTTKKKITDVVSEMEEQGADFVDVGGMSTTPYLSTMVSEKIESQRIVNAIKIIQNVSNLPISVDTCRASVAKDALNIGVEIINDVSGLKYDIEMKKIVEKYQPSLVLCAFSNSIIRGNLLSKTKQLLKDSMSIAKAANISTRKIVLDPAIGFFRNKSIGPTPFTKINSSWVERDLSMIKNLDSIKLKQPILVSVSNKSFIGKILKKENPQERIFGSIAAEIVTVLHGAHIIRTHNVKSTKEAITIFEKLLHKNKKGL